jgi:hypothetical protein
VIDPKLPGPLTELTFGPVPGSRFGFRSALAQHRKRDSLHPQLGQQKQLTPHRRRHTIPHVHRDQCRLRQPRRRQPLGIDTPDPSGSDQRNQLIFLY